MILGIVVSLGFIAVGCVFIFSRRYREKHIQECKKQTGFVSKFLLASQPWNTSHKGLQIGGLIFILVGLLLLGYTLFNW